MTTSNETFSSSVAGLVRSPAFKFFLILGLIILLMIPQMIVWALVSDRESRAREVAREVGAIWGPQQSMTGPVILVPFEERQQVRRGDELEEVLRTRTAVITPAALNITTNAKVQELQRSIFKVPVYESTVAVTGRFDRLQLDGLSTTLDNIRWDDAVLALGISGVRGLKNAAVLTRPGVDDVSFAPSVGRPGLRDVGIHAPLSLRPAPSGRGSPDPSTGTTAQRVGATTAQGFEFTINLKLNGSVLFNVTPSARETQLQVTSDWPHPSFAGYFSPNERRISDTGFEATWSVPHLARSVPERWVVNGNSALSRLAQYAFGVRLVEPVDFYDQISRSLKYGLGFLTLVFMAVFALEVSAKSRVHPVQYLFTGVSLIFFYVLLLALAEHIGFHIAYGLAAIATGVMLAAYCGMALKSFAKGMLMLGVFAGVYGLLYLILQLEDYALLAGALLGFTALTAIMFGTLRVDWSGRGRVAETPSA